MKRKVILFEPRSKHVDEISFPLSCLALAATLQREGFLPIIVDEHVNTHPFSVIEEHLRDTLFVGISSMTDWQIAYGLQICDFVRKSEPNVPIVWGGWHASSLPEQTVADTRVDVVVRGEGDFVVVELAKAFQDGIPLSQIKGITYKKAGTIFTNPDANPITDLNVLPPIDWGLIDIGKYLRAYATKTLCVQSGRGCAMNCTFCSHKSLPYKKPRSFGMDRLIADVTDVIRTYGIDELTFYEPTFVSSRARAVEICETFENAGFRLRWQGSSRANVVSRFEPALCERLARCGCWKLNFGFESGSRRILKRITTKIDTLENMMQTVRLCADSGITVEAYFILGFPGETLADILETVIVVDEIRGIAPCSNICVGTYTPYPGTILYQECVDVFGLPRVDSLAAWGDMSGWSNRMPWLKGHRGRLLNLARSAINAGNRNSRGGETSVRRSFSLKMNASIVKRMVFRAFFKVMVVAWKGVRHIVLRDKS